MLKFLIKKLVARYQRNKLAKEKQLRAKHNWQQVEAMRNALNERGY